MLKVEEFWLSVLKALERRVGFISLSGEQHPCLVFASVSLCISNISLLLKPSFTY